MTSRKSPYLVLGVPYGASKAAATKAFAAATRRVRGSVDTPYDLEDLNWALHQVEQRIENPMLLIDDFRMPADPTVYDVPEGTGVLNPPVVRYPRRTPPTDAATLTGLRNEFLREVARQVADEIRSQPLPRLHSFDQKGT